VNDPTPPPVDATRHARGDDVHAVAALHAAGIPDGFLVSLGPRFLGRLYARIVRSPTSFLLVTDGDRGISGFIAVAEDTGLLYREFLRRDGVVAAAVAAPRVLRAPRRIWETLRYGSVAEEDLPAAEILAMAVASHARGRGTGAALVRAGVGELTRRGVLAARVVTASDNPAALRMYERAGFDRVRRTEVHRGVSQEVLVWR